MEIHESQENYLETILLLHKKNGNVRSIDIANEMDFSRASVSRAVKLLKEKGYIDIDNTNLIKLTEEGKTIAKNVYDRHVTISSFLMKLGVDENTALEDACRMEHVISESSFNKLKVFAEKFVSEE